jgi:hypothetical protein
MNHCKTKMFSCIMLASFLAALFIGVLACDIENQGGEKVNCCQFVDSCRDGVGLSEAQCNADGGDFLPNAQCFEDVGLCLGVEPTPTPAPTPTPGPTPTPQPSPTPGPTPTPQPSPTPEPSPTPTPAPSPTPAPPTCEDVPDRMDDPFFTNSNAVTYEGTAVPNICDGGTNDGLPCQDDEDCPPDGQCVEGDPVDVVAVLTAEITPDGPFCMIALNTAFPGIGNVAGTLTGPITPDGTMCIFDGTTFQVTVPIAIGVAVVTGKATLDGGEVLTVTDFVIVNPLDMMEVPIPDSTLTCVSVTPINDVAKTQEIQIIHREKLDELGIEIGN